jgi:hypothetical protein
MRTKTLALSALLSMIGAASLVAQTNVYSLNAVGYINVTIYPGFNLISCPLICSPDNTLATIMPNGGAGGSTTSNQYLGWTVFQWNPLATPTPTYVSDTANAKTAGNKNGTINSGWDNGGTITLAPGQGLWVDSVAGGNTTLTLVGTVPQNGSPTLTQTLYPGFNMVSSAVPMDGDLVANTNTLLTIAQAGDQVYTWNPGAGTYDAPNDFYTTKHGWTTAGTSGGDPTTTNLSESFWYFVNGGGNETWTENFAIN